MRYLTVITCGIGLLVLTACGNGGSTLGDMVVTSTLPAEAYAYEPADVFIRGVGFAPLGGVATVRFEAESGTPFQSGTESSVEMTAQILGTDTVRGLLPPTLVNALTDAYVIIELPGGTEVRSETPVTTFRPQQLTGASSPLDGSVPTPFQLRGVNLRPVRGRVAVHFTAADTPFYVGPTRISTLVTSGKINAEGTEINGILPYAAVLADTPTTVKVLLPGGGEMEGVGPVISPGSVFIRGQWRYQRVDSTATGLDYGNVTEHPIRGAQVQLIREATGAVITSRILTSTGSFNIGYGGNDQLRLRVLAESGQGEPPIRVEDNTNGNALWSIDSPPFLISGTTIDQDYVAELGWDGAAYTGPRSSAPFAIFDTVYEAMTTIYDARDPTLPICRVNWSPDNRPENGSIEQGQIGGAHYLEEIYLSGKEDVDTDEFDTHLIVHEWGHYLQDKAARDDSIAGPHGPGDILDPRVAYGEGLATGIVGVVLAPDTLYSDTYGPGQTTSFSFDFEDNTDDPTPGWWSEWSIQAIVNDIFDGNNDLPYDNLQLDVGAFYDALVATKDVDSLQSIFTFIDILKKAHPGSAADINTLCGHHDISPVQDEWGTGEAHSTLGIELPPYEVLTIDGPSAVRQLNGEAGIAGTWNWLTNSRFATFVGNGGSVTVNASTPAPTGFISDHDIVLKVWRRGQQLRRTDRFWWNGPESVTLPTGNGDIYVIEVENIGWDAVNYDCTINVVSN